MYDILYLFSVKWDRIFSCAETTISCVITAENPGRTFPKLGRISYPPACNQAWRAPFPLNSGNLYKTQTKPVQF